MTGCSTYKWNRCARRKRKRLLLGVALDITDRKRTEEQVLYQATHDADGLAITGNLWTHWSAMRRANGLTTCLDAAA